MDTLVSTFINLILACFFLFWLSSVFIIGVGDDLVPRTISHALQFLCGIFPF